MLVSFLKPDAPTNPVAVQRAKAIVWKCDPVTSAYLAFYRLYRYASSSDAAAHTDYTVEDKLDRPRFRDEDALADATEYWVRWAWVDQWENESELSAAVSETNRLIATDDVAIDAITVQAGAETSGATSVGTSFSVMQSVTVTWGAIASIWIFCQFKTDLNDELEIDIRSGGTSLLSSPRAFTPRQDGYNHYLDMFPAGATSGAAIDFRLRRTSAGTTNVNARKMLVLATKR